MLAGLDGYLVSHAFLERRVAMPADGLAADARRRNLAQWRAWSAALGPASTTRALLQNGAAPLAAALGFDPPADIRELTAATSATLRPIGSAGSVGLIVAPFGERLDPLWRPAVSEALRRGASWCVLFNGTHLRIVDASRLYARRYLEFDLDLAVDGSHTLAALWLAASAGALCGAADAGESLRALIADSDHHAAAVCRSLRDGVLAASSGILGALTGGGRSRPVRSLHDGFEQSLTIVYRILFLLFARAMARLAHAGCRAGELRVTPFNGRLFAPARTPLAERRDLDDEAARGAVLALSTRRAPDGAGRERISYRDLGVEQLGAVYETLLDYQPCAGPSGVTLQRGSGVRKATGTFYTPQPIAEYVVRRAIGPLVRDATPERILGLRIVDPAMGSGAFLVAACRYLASAYEQALIGAGRCHAADLGERERVAIRRQIAERCLYGVDLNPMAVQLARLSMWLATLAADRPLSFLDHRLQTGDSLLGASLVHLARAPHRRKRSGKSDALPLFDGETVAEALRAALPVRFSLEATPNDTIEQVREKERAYAAITARDGLLSRWKRIANVWAAAWFSSPNRPVPAAAFGALGDVVLSGRGALPPRTAEAYLSAAEAIACARRFFHWELEFPEAFFAVDGRPLSNAGFDAVIGNPPWDMIRADTGAADARDRARVDIAPLLRFTRDAGLYSAQSDGHANRYQLFVERAIALTRAGGRIGLVLPSGLAIDHGSAPLRRMLLNRCDVDAIVGFDNHRGVFPIHRSVRFLLLTATGGAPTRAIGCRLGLDDPADLESAGDEPAEQSPWYPVQVTPEMLARLSGPALTIPNLRSPVDVAIAERAAALFPPLGDAAGWNARFGRELNATDDRAFFHPADPHRADRLPVVEGKHLDPFRAAVGRTEHAIAASDARRLLASDRHERPRLAYRDVASATNRVTLIAAVLPARCVSTHTVFCLRTPLPAGVQHFLCGLFNSLVVNYLVRLRVTTHVTTATVERLPIPTSEMAPARIRQVAALARLLARRDDPAAFARLNALVAALYQLSASEFEHVLDTFPLISTELRRQALQLFQQGSD
ncbi:MAG: hypothetical protein DMF99_18810 [Acidobacteria bacterium]|nr:MAG: hypothetical protein DMF99_18810 [Acidobacteriota bacterium]